VRAGSLGPGPKPRNRNAGGEPRSADVNISRKQPAFVREGAGWAVEDLGSTNGTLVNGKVIDRKTLRDNDVIVVGITELVYHEPRG